MEPGFPPYKTYATVFRVFPHERILEDKHSWQCSWDLRPEVSLWSPGIFEKFLEVKSWTRVAVVSLGTAQLPRGTWFWVLWNHHSLGGHPFLKLPACWAFDLTSFPFPQALHWPANSTNKSDLKWRRRDSPHFAPMCWKHSSVGLEWHGRRTHHLCIQGSTWLPVVSSHSSNWYHFTR